jgi:sulfoacetaldehyde acetyltransferase
VTIDSLDEVGSALSTACKAQGEGKTTVIEISVSRELGDPFRRDALRHPQRLLEKYRKYM